MTMVTRRLREGEIGILGVLTGDEKAEMVEFFHFIPLWILHLVETVCCELKAIEKILRQSVV